MRSDPHFYWMPRSGGTFVWQVLIRLFPLESKMHDFKETSAPIIINYRDPRDITVSFLRIHYGKYDKDRNLIYVPPTKQQITIMAQGTKKHYEKLLQHKQKYGDSKNVLWLRYEDYIDDINVLFDKIAKFMGMCIPPERRAEIKRETSISVNKAIANKVTHWREDSEFEFDQYDKASKIHMHHIYDGPYKGWKKYIPKEFHKYLHELLKNELEEWGYIKK